MTKECVSNMHSFIRGVTSISNISSHASVNIPKNAKDVDTKALASDWEAVGQDISRAIYEYAQQI